MLTIAQAQVSIPAYTGYAVPIEASDSNDESILFNASEGLHNWTDLQQHIQYFFYAGKEGKLKVSLLAKNVLPGGRINLQFNGKNFKVKIPAAGSFRELKVGRISIPHPGFYSFELSGETLAGNAIAQDQAHGPRAL